MMLPISTQTYFYNAKTRESAWTKPDNVKIITQAEVEQMAVQSAQVNAMASGTGFNSMGQTTPLQGMLNFTECGYIFRHPYSTTPIIQTVYFTAPFYQISALFSLINFDHGVFNRIKVIKPGIKMP
ncbi:hypothetical protein DPMN_169310 [Dreissena polymorpha]|uniref:WW domain-containing protein n=1 Tax=Dreissena polymorpha TaxID=45954 RepID=A0A9D4F4D9_DREPO|nr:hypothetical protein DPMN_169310 [Dreissena polymorpha]